MQQHQFLRSTKRLLFFIIILLLTSCAAPAAAPSATFDWELIDVPLRVAYAFDAGSLDPACADPQDVLAATVFNAVYQTLVTYDPGSTDVPPAIVPWLAESMPEPVNETDEKEWDFKLRRDVRFADGNSVTARDVVYSFERLKRLEGAPAFLTDNIEAVEQIDDYTVKFILTQPDPALLPKLASGAFSIVNQGLLEDMRDADSCSAENPLDFMSAGSGTYILKERIIGESILLERNDNYTDEQDEARPQAVIIQIMPDAETQFAELVAGNLDIALNLTPAQLDEIANNPAYQTYQQSSVNLIALATNWNKPDNQTTDQTAQQALRYAIDYATILQEVGGAALTPPSFIPNQFLAANPEAGIKYDPENAARLMEQVGYSESNRLPVRLAYPKSTAALGNSNWDRLAELVAENLQQVYFDVETVGTDGDPLQVEPDLAPDLVLFDKGANYLDALDYLDFLPGGRIANRFNWDNPELAEGRLRALRAVDPDERTSNLMDLQQRLNETGPYAFILLAGLQSAAGESVSEWPPNPQNILFIRRVKVSRYCRNCCNSCSPANTSDACDLCRDNCTNC